MRGTAPLELMFRNLRMLQSVLVEAEPLVRERGLEMKEFFVLNAVDFFPHPADLARELMLPKASITFLVKRMEAARFLNRDGQPGDLRRFRLTLTPRGRRAVEEARAILGQTFGRRLEKLDEEQIKVFTQLLERME